MMADEQLQQLIAAADADLEADDRLRQERYPNRPPSWQPVHTAYVPADRFDAETVLRWQSQALDSLDEHGPVPGYAEYDQAVRQALKQRPIEDLRIDFEDGYGVRGDSEEDAAVAAAIGSVRAHVDAKVLPPAWGLRVKSLESGCRHRAVRTLHLFLQGLTSGGPIPAGFRLTLPKVSSVAQVDTMVMVCDRLESSFELAAGSLRFEIQVETPQAVLGADGRALVAPMLHAARGRCAGLHYGTYDYSASVGIAAAYQSMEHPAADYAKAVLQVAAAATGVTVCDGSTNQLPVGDHDAVLAGWQLHARLVRRSLERGFYQGWDLHPAQLPSRYSATFAFYADGAEVAVQRLVAYLARQAGGVLDEPATARALASFLLRGLDCGALTESRLPSDVLDRAVLHRLLAAGV